MYWQIGKYIDFATWLQEFADLLLQQNIIMNKKGKEGFLNATCDLMIKQMVATATLTDGNSYT